MLSETTSNQEYHLPGILHYLQVEWRRFERERNEWAIERSELKARIALLEGERRGNDNLKTDLIKRVKMLEYALKQERKRHLNAVTHVSANVMEDKVQLEDNDIQAMQQQQQQQNDDQPSRPVPEMHDPATADSRIREKYRQSLKTCLQEINYLTSMPSKLPMTYTLAQSPSQQQPSQPPSSNTQASPSATASNTPAGKTSRQRPTQNRFNTNSHLQAPQSPISSPPATPQHGSLLANATQSASPPPNADITNKSSPPLTDNVPASPAAPVLDNVDEIEMLDNVIDATTATSQIDDVPEEDTAAISKKMQEKFNLSDDRLQKMMKNASKSSKSNKRISPEPPSLDLDDQSSSGADTHGNVTKIWKTKMTFKGHLDSVRTVAFHPDDMLFASGSDDGTIKIVNMQRSVDRDGNPLKKTHEDLDAIATYRGHSHLITKVAIDGEQGRFYSSSLDSTIRVWRLPPDSHTAFSPVDSSLYITTLIGHTDAIWDFQLSPSSPLLASAAADGKVKVWNTTGTADLLKHSWQAGDQHVMPTSVDFCRTDGRKVMVAKTDASIQIYDVETGQVITSWNTNALPDGQASQQINKIVAHPTMNLVLAGYEDRYIRCFDINSGKATFEMSGHLDAVTSLSIEPSGLSFVSGGHDSSLRFWDLAKTKSCIQEISAHRKKGDEGVLAAQFHPRYPWLISCGADAIVKVYHPGHQ
ncbi:WD40 repeat-like protein [Hesseltinella vesiculosa]|uniref:WD40 repeat-like protein n=1 Tax=Hesseltinella vesiculosa TaxID=101127 RepID=A0A1X2GIX8_9FUNG|nr:WD40 repeat-like protein [Hesseltinella vesiculosa]